jgi:site-specific recombinase XerD
MSGVVLMDAAGRPRSPATFPGFRAGCPPRNKGLRFPADPPRVEEIIAVMRAAGNGAHGFRIRGLIVVLWRAGLRINEALSLAETDLEPRRGAILVRHGKGDKRREVGMDDWAWEQLDPWARYRLSLPAGPFFCIVDGATRGRAWSQTGARAELRRLATVARVRRRCAPHQLRHAHAVEMAREGVPLPVIQRQLGHAHLGVTSTLPARDRHQRDHRHDPQQAAADDSRQRRAATMS